jgi:hypothetical protein
VVAPIELFVRGDGVDLETLWWRPEALVAGPDGNAAALSRTLTFYDRNL